MPCCPLCNSQADRNVSYKLPAPTSDARCSSPSWPIRSDRFDPPLTSAAMATSQTTSDVDRSRVSASSELSMVPPFVHTVDSDLCAVCTVGTNSSDDQEKDKIGRLLRSAPSETCTAYISTFRLPYDIVEMTIAYLARDLDALKACSLACRSWYIAAVPRIHHTLTLSNKAYDESRRGLEPLSTLHGFGLAPLIREIQVSGTWPEWGGWFVPQAFSPNDLRHFSAFTNVQTLVLRKPDVGKFIPCIEQYFGHFSPTLRSIELAAPCCTPRQLSYFLSFFPNLDDVNISSPKSPASAAVPDSELVPFSRAKLRGRLELHDDGWVETWTDLIASCGGLRFNYIDLRWVRDCVPFLLGACAETLETLGCSLGK